MNLKNKKENREKEKAIKHPVKQLKNQQNCYQKYILENVRKKNFTPIMNITMCVMSVSNSLWPPLFFHIKLNKASKETNVIMIMINGR